LPQRGVHAGPERRAGEQQLPSLVRLERFPIKLDRKIALVFCFDALSATNRIPLRRKAL
jgi:hypothetical protein